MYVTASEDDVKNGHVAPEAAAGAQAEGRGLVIVGGGAVGINCLESARKVSVPSQA